MNTMLARWRAANLRTRTIALLCLGTVFLLGMAGYEHMKRITGEEIVLRTRPVDPRDLLRGHYVALDYDIETIQAADLQTPVDPSGWKKGDTLYVLLRPDGVGWRPIALSRERMKGEPSDVTLRAGYVGRSGRAGSDDAPLSVSLDIGVDHYYAPRQTAQELEADGRETPLEVILSVGADGGAAIKGLVVRGEKRYETFF